MRAIGVALGLGGELRTFHADVGAAALGDDSGGCAGLGDDGGEFRADGVAKGDVGDDAFAEEGGDALLGAVVKLVGNDEVGGLVLFLERADGRNGENALDAKLLEAVNVGAEIQLGGEDAMAASVTGEESNFASGESAEDIGVRGCAEGSFELNFVNVSEALHGIKAAAANDADLCLCQCNLLRVRKRSERKS